jgi:hypothetical protein
METEILRLPARPVTEILDAVAAATGLRVSFWLSGHAIRSAELLAWDGNAEIAVCRGGEGFSEEEIHYVPLVRLGAGKYHLLSFGQMPEPPANQISRIELERMIAEVRDQIRMAAGAPVGLVARGETLGDGPAHRTLYRQWLESLREAVAAVCADAGGRETFRAAVEQILMRRGGTPVSLGGSTLIVETEPDAIPGAEDLRVAILAALD